MENETFLSVLQILLNNLDQGVVLSNEDARLCCPDCVSTACTPEVQIYALASVETALLLVDATSPCTCCMQIKAGVETTLKFWEGVSLKCENNDINNPAENCADDFYDCVNHLTTGMNSLQVSEILSSGIVEIGSSENSAVCYLKAFLNNTIAIDPTYNSQNIHELLLKVLDKGIAIMCREDEIYMGSVETILKALEATCGDSGNGQDVLPLLP
jgi:hypothetical protein